MSILFHKDIPQLIYATLNVDVNSSGPTVATTIMEWASFQIPDQVM